MKKEIFFEKQSLDFTNAGAGPAGTVGTPSASQSVHQPGAEINQRWGFSDSVVSGGGTLCPLAGTSISLPLSVRPVSGVSRRDPSRALKVAAEPETTVLLFTGSSSLPEEAH